jgi:hypothetical protein
MYRRAGDQEKSRSDEAQEFRRILLEVQTGG